jgi:hypothetical protein
MWIKTWFGLRMWSNNDRLRINDLLFLVTWILHLTLNQGPRNGLHNAEDLVLDNLISGQPCVGPHMRTSYVDIDSEPEFLDLKCEPRKVDPQISGFFFFFWLNYANWFFSVSKWLKKRVC